MLKKQTSIWYETRDAFVAAKIRIKQALKGIKWIGQLIFSNFFSMIAHFSLVREAILVISKETGGWLFPKRVHVITKSVKINLFFIIYIYIYIYYKCESTSTYLLPLNYVLVLQCVVATDGLYTHRLTGGYHTLEPYTCLRDPFSDIWQCLWHPELSHAFRIGCSAKTFNG